MSLILKVKLFGDAKLPTYHYEGDAGLDLYSAEDITLKPNERRGIKTGASIAIPDGYVGLIWDKSGLSMKHGLKTLGGVVDSGYRGEVIVGLVNVGDDSYTFQKGDKVAQMIIQKKEMVIVEETDSLPETQRGDKGFGSSGK